MKHTPVRAIVWTAHIGFEQCAIKYDVRRKVRFRLRQMAQLRLAF